MNKDRWLLPEGVEEVVPPEAWRLERMRRRVIDLYAGWGYELIMPPLIEFLDSLLTGTGRDLDLQTFKITDQLTGRLMGIRSDITPQAARIDAHRLRREAPVRLCYVASVLRTRPDTMGASRSPRQAGVELFGHDGVDSDLEVLSLMIETLQVAGIDGASIDLGHVGIYRAIVEPLSLDADDNATLFDILQRKALPDLAMFVSASGMADTSAALLRALISLNGEPADVIARARSAFAESGDVVASALTTVETIIERVSRSYPDISIHVDLAELRGYRYETGVVFAAFAPGLGQDVARGGRYNDVGQVFGRARPASGFSADLNALVRYGTAEVDTADAPAIMAPALDDPGLLECIRELRASGRRVVVALPGAEFTPADFGCDEILTSLDGNWGVVPVDEGNSD